MSTPIVTTPGSDGFPPAPLPINSANNKTLTLVSASPLSSRTLVAYQEGLGDGSQASFDINAVGDQSALNNFCKKQQVFFGAIHVENVDQLRNAILAT